MPAVVQSAKNAGTGTSLTVTLASPTTAGNCLFVLVLTSGPVNGTVNSVKLGGVADNFSTSALASEGNSGDHAVVTCWADPDCAAGQTSIAITTTGSSGVQAISAIVYEASGMPTTRAALLDKTAVFSSSGFVSSWTLGPTATTTHASELWLAIVGGNANQATAATLTGPASGWTNTGLTGVNNYANSVSLTGSPATRSCRPPARPVTTEPSAIRPRSTA